MTRNLLLTILASATVACSPEAETASQAAAAPAPASEAEVCWRIQAGERRVVDRVPNLPTCAQRLEAVRMMEGGGPVEGAYEGRTIKVTEADITQGRPGGERYPVFTTGQRRELQAAITKLLEQRGAEGPAR